MRVYGFYGHKGGQGTTVTACAFALSLGVPVAVLDVSPVRPGGDVFGVFGTPEPFKEGALVQVSEFVEVRRVWCGGSVGALRSELEGLRRREDLAAVVVDFGTWVDDEALQLVDVRILVTRACYLALRRCSTCRPQPVPDAVALVLEPGRALGARDVARVVGVEVGQVTVIPVDPAVARGVDAGLLASRLPRVLVSGLRELAALVEAAGQVTA